MRQLIRKFLETRALHRHTNMTLHIYTFMKNVNGTKNCGLISGHGSRQYKRVTSQKNVFVRNTLLLKRQLAFYESDFKCEAP